MSSPRIRLSPANVAAGLFKLLIAATVVVALVPPLRARAAPHLAFAIDPVRRVTTQDRVNSVARYVEYDTRISGHAPQDRDLPRVFARMFPGRPDAMLDPWGRRYFLRRHGDGFQVGSAGPDQRRDTPDDVLSGKHPLPPPRGSSRIH
jgi:hypothetical protein